MDCYSANGARDLVTKTEQSSVAPSGSVIANVSIRRASGLHRKAPTSGTQQLGSRMRVRCIVSSHQSLCDLSVMSGDVDIVMP